MLLADGHIELHEVKGTTARKTTGGEKRKVPYVLDDARVKIKVAAEMFPVVFRVVYQVAGEWVEDEV